MNYLQYIEKYKMSSEYWIICQDFGWFQAAMRRYNGITNKEDRGMGMTKEEILVHVDHTLLKAVSAWDEIQTLCEEAIETIRLRSVSSKLC